jgi:squalene-hopene/tetraprenyl-beta-curcumene cyclase
MTVLRPFTLVLFSLAVLLVAGPAAAAAEDSSEVTADAKAYQQAVEQAIHYLASKGQAPDGSYSGQLGPGVTALVTTGILRHGRSPEDPLVARSLKYLEGFIRDDGGVYGEGSFHRNYETSLAIMAFTAANKDGRYDKVIDRAEKFLKGIQWDDGEGHGRSSPSYGGAGYGSHKRPDLSNTSFLVEALLAAGNGPNDPAMQKALVFVSRCQNLETEHNTTKHASKINDGGFYYTCAAGGESKAGETANGGLRSYASMTYAGLKSMIYAGLGPDDPRVKAALKWARKHYRLDSNPGMGQQGLYYYYQTFAKALHAAGIDKLTDDQGVEHDWRRDLLTALAKRQRPDGSWLNEADRWYEGDPNLVTAYCLMALSHAKPATGD